MEKSWWILLALKLIGRVLVLSDDDGENGRKRGFFKRERGGVGQGKVEVGKAKLERMRRRGSERWRWVYEEIISSMEKKKKKENDDRW